MPTKIPERSGSIRLEQILEELNIYDVPIKFPVSVYKGSGSPCDLDFDSTLYDFYFDTLNQQWYNKEVDIDKSVGIENNPLNPTSSELGTLYTKDFNRGRYWFKVNELTPTDSDWTLYQQQTDTNNKLNAEFLLYNSGGYDYHYFKTEGGNQASTISAGIWEAAGFPPGIVNDITVAGVYQNTVTNPNNIISPTSWTDISYLTDEMWYQWDMSWLIPTNNHNFYSIDIKFSNTITLYKKDTFVLKCSNDNVFWKELVDLCPINTSYIGGVTYTFTFELDNQNYDKFAIYTEFNGNNNNVDTIGFTYDTVFSVKNLQYIQSDDCVWMKINEPTWYKRLILPLEEKYNGPSRVWDVPLNYSGPTGPTGPRGLPYEGYYQIDVFVAGSDYALQDPGPPPVYNRVSTTDPDTLTAKGTGDSSAQTIDLSGHILVPVGETAWYNNSLQGSCIVKVTGDSCTDRSIQIVYTAGPASTTHIDVEGYVHIEYLGNQELDTCY